MTEPYDLDTVLLNLGDNITWTARNAVEGTQIFGGIGSGKTSGSGETLAKKFLQQGYGGLVLTVKPNEVEENWIPYCKATNREKDLIIVKPNGDHAFNFISYELNREGVGGGLVDNLVNIFKTVIRASKAQKSNSNDDFWEDALDMLMTNVLDLCFWAWDEHISIDKIFAVLNSIPKSVDEYRKNAERIKHNQKNKTNTHSKSAFFRAFEMIEVIVSYKLSMAKKAYEDAYKNDEDPVKRYFGNRHIHIKEWQDYVRLHQYFKDDFLPLAPKTKSIIEHMFKGFLFRLNREPIFSLLCAPEYDIVPEQCLDGKIIILDLPVKEYDKVGRDAQILFKYIWQRAMERRNTQKDKGTPVFLWADEAQNFLHEHDIDYQATARSSRVCTVYLTQNLPNYHAHLGGKDGEYQVKSFLGTMGTKIFHANADIDTNKYASDLIGEIPYEDKSTSHQMSGEFNTSMSNSYKLRKAVRPEQFIALKTGGAVNNHLVHAYIHKQGTPWNWSSNNNTLHRKQNFKIIEFHQTLEP